MTQKYEETKFDVFVPVGQDAYGIDPKSAIVAGESQRGNEMLIVHVEGNRYGFDNIKTLEDRCLHAAGRAATRYPTVAKFSLLATELRLVGTYDLNMQCFTAIDEPEALQAWLGEEPLPSVYTSRRRF